MVYRPHTHLKKKIAFISIKKKTSNSVRAFPHPWGAIKYNYNGYLYNQFQAKVESWGVLPS